MAVITINGHQWIRPYPFQRTDVRTGTKGLFHDGYKFHLKSRNERYMYWKCAENVKATKCPCKIKTDINGHLWDVRIPVPLHNHPRPPYKKFGNY